MAKVQVAPQQSRMRVGVRIATTLAVLALAVELTISGLHIMSQPLEERYYHSGETDWVMKLPKKPKVLFMGSSTILYSIDPRVIASKIGLDSGEVLNLAGAGFTPIHSLNVWKSIAPAVDSVKYVFYGLDSWLFSERKFQRDDFLMLQWSLPQRVWIATHRGFHPYARDYCLTGIPWLHVLLTSVYRPIVSHSDIPVGFGAQTEFLKAWDPWTPPSKDLYPQFLFPLSDLCFQRLRDLRDSVESHGAQLIFVLPPKHSAWRKDYVQNCADFDAGFIARFNREIGPHRVIGSFEMLSSLPDSTVMLDFVHTTKTGQHAFSTMIADTLRDIIREPKPRSVALQALWKY